ncbi:hypothetical protein ACFXJ5_12010 [Streptomyces sp. NPDC059373]
MLTGSSSQDSYVSAGLLASLSAFTWVGLDPAEAAVGMVLVTHAPVRSAEGTGRSVEQGMRDFAVALGMGSPEEPIPDLGPCLSIHAGSQVVLRPEGSRYGLRLPAQPRWVRLLLQRMDVAVIVGLDPLARTSGMADIDGYLDHGLKAGRLFFGTARAVRSRASGVEPTC